MHPLCSALIQRSSHVKDCLERGGDQCLSVWLGVICRTLLIWSYLAFIVLIRFNLVLFWSDHDLAIFSSHWICMFKDDAGRRHLRQNVSVTFTGLNMTCSCQMSFCCRKLYEYFLQYKISHHSQTETLKAGFLCSSLFKNNINCLKTTSAAERKRRQKSLKWLLSIAANYTELNYFSEENFSGVNALWPF